MITIEIEHRCHDCNKLIRFQRVNVREVDAIGPIQRFDEVCKECQEEADEN